MALLLGTWDLPADDKMDAYLKAAPRWIATNLSQPGLKEYRVYRNPLRTSPHAMAHYEFDSMESLMRWVQTEEYAAILSEMRALGANIVSVQIWGTSPTAPEPLKPAGR